VTLRCECGGSVRVQHGSDPAADRREHWEAYECEACGRTGTYEWNTATGVETLTGCLTRSTEVHR
jgi:N-methylhydantoinase B/oxoprolinase/acetone carboxylase alpha subunit